MFLFKAGNCYPRSFSSNREIRKDNDSSKDRQDDRNPLTYALYKCRNGKWAFFDCNKLPELLNS